MRRSTLRTAVAVVTAGLTLTACGGSGGGSGSGGGGSDAATATSAEDLGGMDALVKAAQEGGHAQRHRAAAGLGELRRDARRLRQQVRHQDQQRAARTAPARTSSTPSPARRGRTAPPTSSTWAPASPCRPPAQNLLAPYKVATWGDIPDNQKDPDGQLVQRLRRLHLDRLQRLDGAESARPPSRPMLDPQYTGQVALNGNPTQAAAAFSGVWAAVAGQRRQPGRHRPGHRLLRRR